MLSAQFCVNSGASAGAKHVLPSPDFSLQAAALFCVCCVLPPWDILRSPCFDVVLNRESFRSASELADLEHYAPNCGTFTRARERRIVGVKGGGPKPLRTLLMPTGVSNLQGRSLKRVMHDTDMANLSAADSLKRHRSGRFFSLEHPARSST